MQVQVKVQNPGIRGDVAGVCWSAARDSSLGDRITGLERAQRAAPTRPWPASAPSSIPSRPWASVTPPGAANVSITPRHRSGPAVGQTHALSLSLVLSVGTSITGAHARVGANEVVRDSAEQQEAEHDVDDGAHAGS